MTVLPPEPGSSRRDNGLQSAEWGALVDVDPRLSEGLLDSLAAVGVPAFVEPARDVDTISRATTHPKRPLDRLWVDPDRAGQARDIVCSEIADLTALLAEDEPGATAHGLVRPVPRSAAARVLSPPDLPKPPTGPPVLDDDEVFRQIVAGFDTGTTSPVPPWPVSEDLPPAAPPGAAPRRRRTDAPLPVEPLPGWVEPAALPDDEHFEPPPPPPVPRVRARTALSVVQLLVGLVMLFAPGLLRLSDGTGVLLMGMSLTGGGAAMLVWWMRDVSPHDRGPDDGAVV